MKDRNDKPAINAEAVEKIASAVTPVEPPQGLFDRIAARLDTNAKPSLPDFLTLRADEGAWIDLAPGLRKKTLHVDAASNVESFLLQFDSGAEFPEHQHTSDELCLMLEGEVFIGDVRMSAGDFHFAKQGTLHGRFQARSAGMLFIQSQPAA